MTRVEDGMQGSSRPNILRSRSFRDEIERLTSDLSDRLETLCRSCGLSLKDPRTLSTQKKEAGKQRAQEWALGGDVRVSLLPSDICRSSCHLYPMEFGNRASHDRRKPMDDAVRKKAQSAFATKLLKTNSSQPEELAEEGHGRDERRRREGTCRDTFTYESVDSRAHALIKEATSIDNLARMFEGWMPWV